jgi:hypothetical protein
MKVLCPLVLIPLAAVLSVAAQDQRAEMENVLSLFPRCHLLTLEERDPDTKAFLVKHLPKSNPSVVHADFDGDGHVDYALLLKNGKTANTKLVVLLCPSLPCKTVYELDLTGSAGEVYLKRITAGTRVSQTDAIDTNKNVAFVSLASAGIRLVYFEKAEVVLHWNQKSGKIQEIQTGD